MKRREFIKLVAGSTAAGVTAWPATATAQPEQDYPARQVTLIAPWPAGGAIDTICRALGPQFSDRLGKPVVIENRPGAGSVIGTAAVAKATPDGYTLVMAGSGSLAVSPTLYKKLPYDSSKDFAPIILAAYVPFILVVNPSLPVHSLSELVQYARNNPGKLSYASGGPGSPHQLYAELLKSMTGIEMLHVPYKGNAPALTDVLADHVPLMFSDAVIAIPQIRTGKLRALGLSSAARLPSAPDIPPLAEVGLPGFDAAGWGMVVAPAGTPASIVTRLYNDLSVVLAEPELRKQIAELGMVPANSPPPSELQAFINKERLHWGGVVEQAGLAGSE